jgi:hypothetical protein
MDKSKEAPTNDKSDMKRKRNINDINVEIDELNKRGELKLKHIKSDSRSRSAQMALKKRGINPYSKNNIDEDMDILLENIKDLEENTDFDSMTTDELLELHRYGNKIIFEGIKSYKILFSKIKDGTYKKEKNTEESSK